jgi:HEAT repeat protein
MRSGRIGVRTLMLLIGTSGAVLWAARIVFDTVAPVHRWAREIRHGNTDGRLEAARNLGSIPAKDVGVAVPALAAGLGDEDESVAAMAARSLGQTAQMAVRTGDAGAARTVIRALTGALKEPRPGVRAAAVGGLSTAAGAGPIGAGTAESLTVALVGLPGDESEETRSMAAGALGPVGEHNPVPPPRALIAALEGDRSAEVRSAAARSLGRFQTGRDAATLALLRGLEPDEPRVRAACDAALGVRSPVPGERRSAEIVPALIGALASRERRVRYHAAAILGEIGPEAASAIPTLIGMLREPADREMSRGLIDSGVWDLACQAARALGRVGPGTPRTGEVVRALAEVVGAPGLGRRRAVAADALARFDPGQIGPTLPILLAVLSETAGEIGPPAPSVCAAVGRAAAATPRSADAVAGLTKALDSGSQYTRCEAARALARFGCWVREAVPRLRALATGDQHQLVRDAASSALATIGETANRPGPD